MINRIQRQVGRWSYANFGQNGTPYLRCRTVSSGFVRGTARSSHDTSTQNHNENLLACLGALAPLLGIVEEAGELSLAKNEADEFDAVGDICIYLCDYCHRSDVFLADYVYNLKQLPESVGMSDPAGIAAGVGLLARAELKRHQRIRGFHVDKVYHEARDRALTILVWHIAGYCIGLETTFSDVLSDTWKEIVSERDWNKDAEGGGGHSH